MPCGGGCGGCGRQNSSSIASDGTSPAAPNAPDATVQPAPASSRRRASSRDSGAVTSTVARPVLPLPSVAVTVMVCAPLMPVSSHS